MAIKYLAKHKDVSTVKVEVASGILEPNLFVNYPRFLGPLKYSKNYSAFIILFNHSNFFKVNCLSKQKIFDKENIGIIHFQRIHA